MIANEHEWLDEDGVCLNVIVDRDGSATLSVGPAALVDPVYSIVLLTPSQRQELRVALEGKQFAIGTIGDFVDADRIYACVNAMAGVEDPAGYVTRRDAEISSLRETYEIAAEELIDENAALTKQRDALLEAAKIGATALLRSDSLDCRPLARLVDAIALCEGESNASG